ncbi:hemolytic lectin lslb [Stemphylium lycopersici]|nr:hemolytic lectin lslb [Stemphylium lycopersici]
MSSTLYVPHPNIRTRLVGVETKRVLFSHPRDKKALNHVDMAVTRYDDQYWYIKPGQDKYKGKFLVVSAYTERSIYINQRDQTWGDVGTTSAVGAYGDQFLDIIEQQQKGARTGQFRLHAPSANAVIFLRTHAEPWFGCVSGKTNYSDQYFAFELEPLDFVSIEYDFNSAEVLGVKPKTIFSEIVKNDSGSNQEKSVNIKEKSDQQFTFESEVGLQLEAPKAFKCKVPVLTNKGVELGGNEYHDMKWDTSNTTSQTWEATVKLRIPAGKSMRVTAAVTESIVQVPFVTTWKSPKSGKTATTKGMYKGVSGANLSTYYFPVEN